MSHLSSCVDSSQLGFLQQMQRYERNVGTSRHGIIPAISARAVSAGAYEWVTPPSHDLPRGSGAPPLPRYPRESPELLAKLASQLDSSLSRRVFGSYRHATPAARLAMQASRSQTPDMHARPLRRPPETWNGFKTMSQLNFGPMDGDTWALSRHEWGKGKDKNAIRFREDVFTEWNTFGKGKLTGWRP